MRVNVPLEKAYLLLNHGPTLLVTATDGGKPNVMASAWNTALDLDPPKIAIVLSGESHTRHLIDRSHELALSIPSSEIADLVLSVGKTTGAEIDKFDRFKIRTFPAKKVGAPLIDGCLGWLECRVIPEPRIAKTYDLLIAEVVSAQVVKGMFGPDGWIFAPKGVATIHHLGKGRFAVPSRTLIAKKK
jgi:flavin reductase (DIM6/NTAB) family NADH-FMN oxidoreductase RutF